MNNPPQEQFNLFSQPPLKGKDVSHLNITARKQIQQGRKLVMQDLIYKIVADYEKIFAKPIAGKLVIESMKTMGKSLSERGLRSAVEELRDRGFSIGANHSKGYFIVNSEERRIWATSSNVKAIQTLERKIINTNANYYKLTKL